MKMTYTLLVATLTAQLGAAAEELDQDRANRIGRRFGQLVKIEESQAADAPELPVEPDPNEPRESWNLFGANDEPMSQPMAAPQMQRRPISQLPTKDKNDTGWGWLHAEVLQTQEKREAELLAAKEVADLSAEQAWRPSAMSEEDIQKEVALRLKQEQILRVPKDDATRLNPLKQLRQYNAMGEDYLTPAQQMISPDYARKQLESRKKIEKAEPSRFVAPALSGSQLSGTITAPYGATPSTFGELRQSSALPRASSLTPQLTPSTSTMRKPSYETPKRTIRDLRTLPSLQEQDPFEKKFPEVRRSIWDK